MRAYDFFQGNGTIRKRILMYFAEVTKNLFGERRV